MKVWQVLWRRTGLLHDISIWYRSVEPISNLADCFQTASKTRHFAVPTLQTKCYIVVLAHFHVTSILLQILRP